MLPGPLALGALVELDGAQAHYLLKVMRVAEGDAVVLCDDVTGEWAARVVRAGKRDLTLEPETLLRPREQVPDFTLCAALLKKDRFDLVLEKACELGVRQIQPVLTRRCVADKLNLERARAVVDRSGRAMRPHRAARAGRAGEARRPAARLAGRAARCSSPTRRAAIPPPRLSPPMPGPPRCSPAPKAASTRPSAPPSAPCPRPAPITLGPRILRGETAAIAATALWMAIAGDWK